MLCHQAWVSIYSCAAGGALLVPFLLSDAFSGLIPATFWIRGLLLLLYFGLLNLHLRQRTKGEDYQIAWRAALLGFVLAMSITIFSCSPDNWKPLGIYGTFLAVFHYSEYLGIAFSNPSTLTTDSFILYHSIHYVVAAVASWIEFIVESYFFPQIKVYRTLWILGVILCAGGELLRKLAMITASTSFNHVVQFVRHKDHTLVKTGVYGLMRHPSYVGWFYWSIGTQIILANPICLIVYTVASWKFFHDRVYMEEITLLNFFGDEYYKYQLRVPTGLPLIKGYKVQL